MTRRIKIWVVLILCIIILVVCNYRYSFFSPASNGWSIGFRPIDNPLQKIRPSKDNIFSYDSLNQVTNSQTRFLADPFLFYQNDIYYIFFEHQMKEGPAKIGVLESIDGENYDFRGNVIEEKFHLSFPQVFKNKKDYYILPESASIGQVILYKASDFPITWNISDTLIKNINLKDPAILLSDSLNLIIGIDDNWNQRIFEADSLFGQWNEIKDFKTRKGDEIRPGGNFFEVEGEWYIPFQNNFEGYGTGVSLYKLKSNEFEKVIPNQLHKSETIIWFGRGMHHLNVNKCKGEYYLVYDGDQVLKGKTNFTFISSIKYNLTDIYNLFF